MSATRVTRAVRFAAFLAGLIAATGSSAWAQAVGFAPGVGVAPSGAMLGVTPAVVPPGTYVRMGLNVGFNEVTGFTTVPIPAAVSGGGAASPAALGGLLGRLGGNASGAMGNGGAAILNGGPFGTIGAVSGVGTYGGFGYNLDPFNSMAGLNTFGGYAGPGAVNGFGEVQGFNAAGNYVGGGGNFGPMPGYGTNNRGGAGLNGVPGNFIGSPLGSKGRKAELPAVGPEAEAGPASGDPFQMALESSPQARTVDPGQGDGTAPRRRYPARGGARARGRTSARAPVESKSHRGQDGTSPPATATRSRP
ncbi:hypothetical protein [Aquisphaera insulae]|uniref:hypothetical protein n=1 Tax=Aquisphaera insulae TaxID=2712864 RepID=UPI0013EDD7AF|nr:hypothetical protein [Aquisphaera insulae]